MTAATRTAPVVPAVFKRMALIGSGLLGCGLAVAADRVWANLLVGTYYLLTLALGCAVFLALTYVTGAGWHVAFRRIPEAIATVLPWAGMAMLIVLGTGVSSYAWQPHGSEAAGSFWFKQLWLARSFWGIRAAAYILLWGLFVNRLVARSARQDRIASQGMMVGTIRLSAVFLALFAVTFSLASVDWIMALEPMWFSTMWGVYNFAGMFQAALAAMVLVALALRTSSGPIREAFRDEHLHDLGKLLLGFSCFWMYIWFCQYMLIWYSNLPEETAYFATRLQGSWGPVIVLAVLLNWIIPFLVLLPRAAKRDPSVMMKVSVCVLIGRWVDLYVMVFPSLFGGSFVFGIWEVAAMVCLAGTLGWLSIRSFSRMAPVPRRDPFLTESLHYHAS